MAEGINYATAIENLEPLKARAEAVFADPDATVAERMEAGIWMEEWGAAVKAIKKGGDAYGDAIKEVSS